MIPDTLPHYAFIRLSIWGLRAIAPAAAAYTVATSLGYRFLPWPLELLAYAEVFFYFCVSLPRQRALDKSSPRPILRSQQERRQLFERCWASIPDLESFLCIWFKGADLSSIHRDNLKDFLAWGFLYKTKASVWDDAELESYVRRTEEKVKRKFPPGRGSCRPSQVSTDALQLQHKPLLFYVVSKMCEMIAGSQSAEEKLQLAVGVDDLITYVTARLIGLEHYRLPLLDFFQVFPFRPHTLFTRHESPSKEISYWYRPHTSTTRLPVLFIHGIGVGMRTYTGFFRDFIQQDETEDGQVGIIAVELMQISMRITKGIPPRMEMLVEIMKILDHHEWSRFTVMGHSYGTIIVTHLLQYLQYSDRVGPMILVDPITLSIHWGGIPYNFLYRPPRKASEWQLHYFASTDMCAAHSITRRFDWSENVLWRDEIRARAVTVALAGKDIIIDPLALSRYLIDDEELDVQSYTAETVVRDRRHLGRRKRLDIVWFDELNHSEMFDKAKDWRPLVAILHDYCSSRD